MPSLVEGAEKAVCYGRLASQWGLSADVIIAGGGGDNAASAVGVGAVNDGDALISLGTSGVILWLIISYKQHHTKASMHLLMPCQIVGTK